MKKSEDISRMEILAMVSERNDIHLSGHPTPRLPAGLEKKLEKLYDGKYNTRVTVAKLEELILKHPKVEFLYIFLYTFYVDNFGLEKAEKILNRLLNLNPKNIFALSVKIFFSETKEEMEAHGKLLGTPRKASLFFGTKNIFVENFRSYQEAAISLDLLEGDFESAIDRLEDLRQLGCEFDEYCDWAEQIAKGSAILTIEKLFKNKNRYKDADESKLIDYLQELLFFGDKSKWEEENIDETRMLVAQLQVQVVAAIMQDIDPEDFEFNYSEIFGDEDDEFGDPNDFLESEDLPEPNQAPIVNMYPKVGRNDPCPCGSGKKHKKCCL